VETLRDKGGEVIVADSIYELLTYDDPRFSIRLGYVHHAGGQYRCPILIDDRTFPPIGENGPRLGEVLLHRLSHINTAAIAFTLRHCDLRGWLCVSQSWLVNEPEDGAEQQLLAHHPRRQHSLIATYLDQHTGKVTYRTATDTEINSGTLDEPEEGWNPDNVGTIVPAMQLLRAAASR
jgi:hypothetical protein